MRHRKFRWAFLALVAGLGLCLTPTAQAVQQDWDPLTPAGTYLWHDTDNWITGVLPTDDGGLVAKLHLNNGGTAVTVDLNGTPVNLGSSRVEFRHGLWTVDDLTQVDPALKARLTADNIWSNNASGTHIFNVPITANLFRCRLNPNQPVDINAPFSIKVFDKGWPGSQGRETLNINASPEIPIEHFKHNNWITNFNQPGTITKLTAISGHDTNVFKANAALTIDTLEMHHVANRSAPTFEANAAVTIGTFDWQIGTYAANVDGGMPLGTYSIPGGSSLLVGDTQSAWPTMLTVSAGATLSGDVTGAVYSGTPNTVFEPNAILGVTGGTAPTRAELGGAILLEGLANASTGGPYTFGDDGNASTIFKGFALGSWQPNNDIRAELGAIAGTGDLTGAIVAKMENHPGAIYRGDGISTTANISFYGPASGLILTGGFNEDAIVAAETNLINTFNLTRPTGFERTDVVEFENGGPIDATQTINVSGGRLNDLQNLTGGNLKGALTVTNGEVEQPNDDFTAADTGSLHFGDRAVVSLTNTGNLDCYEGLGTRLTYSGNPVAYLQHNATYDFDANGGPVLDGFLANADYVVSQYKVITMASDVPLGHGKYIFNTYDRGNGNGWRNATGDEAVVYAKNGPMDGTDWIGIAATNSNQPMDIKIDAPDATLVCGTDDPTRLFTAVSGGFVDIDANNTVSFNQTVTAAGLEIRSGTAQFNLDLAIPSIDVGTGTTLRMAGGTTATVADTLSANGTVTGGDGLLLDDLGTFQWEISSNPTDGGGAQTGVAGTDWNLLTATSKVDFGAGGTILFSPMIDPSMTDTIALTDEFIVATGNIDEPTVDGGSWSFVTNPGWDVSAATLVYSDGNLVLSGVTYSIFDPTDLDRDGDTDLVDIDLLTAEADLPTGLPVLLSNPKFDLSGNGMVDSADLDKWLVDAATVNGYASPYLKGDANLDGDVDVWAFDGTGDAQVLSSNLGTMTGMIWSDGDFNGDGDVDVWAFDGSGDAQALSSNLGKTNDAAEGTAEAIYNAVTGELTFDVGEGVAVVGIQAEGMKHGDVDSGSPLGAPGQNAGNVLAYFSASGLTAGMANVGAVLPTGLTAGDINFAYTPLGGATTAVAVTVIVPEPSTIAMLLVVAGLALCRRRRQA